MDYDKYDLDYLQEIFERHHMQYSETLEVIRKNNPDKEPDPFSLPQAFVTIIKELKKLKS